MARRVVVSEFVTLDGVIEDPGGVEKSPHGGWSLQYFSPEAGKVKFEELMAADALLLGRKTYEAFAAAWPSMTDEQGFADRMNSLPKHVATTTLDALTWNARRLDGDVPAAVAALKEQPGGDLLVAGSATLIATLAAHDLVDEYKLMVHPITVGGGKRIWPDGMAAKMDLTETRALGAGVVLLTYTPV